MATTEERLAALVAEYDRKVNIFIPQYDPKMWTPKGRNNAVVHVSDVLRLLDAMIACQESAAAKAALMLARKRIAGETP